MIRPSFSTRRLFGLTSTHELDGPHFYQTVLPSSISPALTPCCHIGNSLVGSRPFGIRAVNVAQVLVALTSNKYMGLYKMEEMAARDKNIEQIINGGRAEKEKKSVQM